MVDWDDVGTWERYQFPVEIILPDGIPVQRAIDAMHVHMALMRINHINFWAYEDGTNYRNCVGCSIERLTPEWFKAHSLSTSALYS